MKNESKYSDKETRVLKNAFSRALERQAGRIRGEYGNYCQANEIYTMKAIRALCRALDVGQVRVFNHPPRKREAR